MNVSSKQKRMQKGAEMSEPIATGSGDVYENLGFSDAVHIGRRFTADLAKSSREPASCLI